MKKISSDALVQSEGKAPGHLNHNDGTLHGRKLATVQFILFFGLVLSVMDSSIVATALVDIGKYFNNFVTLQWVVQAYLLTYVGFALLFSRLSDVWGRKWTTIISLLILATMSLGCGLAKTLDQLIAFRAVQGLGGSGLFSMAMTTAPEVTPPRKFGLLSAMIGLSFAVSAVLGPVIGGVITTHSTWRWCFLFNVPCAGFLIILALLLWPEMHSAGNISWKQMDFFGCLLYTATTVLLVFALQEAGAEAYAWGSATIVACLVVAGLALAGYIMWTWFLSSKTRSIAPLVPGRIFVHRVLAFNIVVSALIGYVFYTILIELPQRFQIVNGQSAQTAGIGLLPLSGASALGSTFGGMLNSRRNNTNYTLTIACAFVTLGCGLIYSIDLSHTVPHALYGFEVLLGFGIGGVFSTTTVITKIHAEKADNAPAQGLLSQLRIFGGNIGLAMATLVLNRRFSHDLADILSPAQIRDLKASLNALATFDPQQQAAVAHSFAASFRKQLQICVVLAAVSVVLCLGTWQRHPPKLAIDREGAGMVEEEEGRESVSGSEKREGAEVGGDAVVKMEEARVGLDVVGRGGKEDEEKGRGR